MAVGRDPSAATEELRRVARFAVWTLWSLLHPHFQLLACV